MFSPVFVIPFTGGRVPLPGDPSPHPRVDLVWHGKEGWPWSVLPLNVNRRQSCFFNV